MRIRRLFIVLLALFTFVPACSKKEDKLFYETGRAEAPVKDVPKDIMATQQAFVELVKKVTPSVVNISTISRKKVEQPFFEFSPFFGDLFGDGKPRYRRDKSLGSGFIINKSGYIVTNDHVVRDAETIKVKLSNENVYDGRVVGSDPKTDIAVIKIDAKEDLPVAVLADSDKLQVGQWAIAIGNPFGLDRTVTVGVVSATGRSNMGIETYEDFIQTDASINPGNSGGPLLNVHGEVIGINTAIVAAGQGIGFAIPVNMAKQIVTQLVTKGSVSRGWLGVSIQPVTDEIAREFGLKKTRGVLVADVVEGSPAAKGGIRQGDIILDFAGTEIKDAQHLQRVVAATAPGKTVQVTVFRGGREVKLSLTSASADSAAARQARPQGEEPDLLGLMVDDIPSDLRRRGVSGVIVAEVDEEGIAAEAGIQRGDIIVSVNRKGVATRAEYERAMVEAGRRGTAILLVRRGNASIFFSLRLR
ncbi:DegQ family serine endoprotease [Geobacter hydrogenophilus]|uniref:Peptidase n=1 Tax=Geobacter hydrogenophilus TaxID=40983 RepID=A0A9W6FZZ9_9BACT|nr:DegQ family serine endoprotease [Geobacter hydrogenophilus]MBT0893375.1 DegQ family serine endoprotease [Geobacter hydrogenophilus]GLI37930.1 peptidase [Geobacter hydrogenophilus]